MPPDYIGLLQVAVSVSPKTPAIQKKVLLRLDVMQRELHYVQFAIAALKAELSKPSPSSTPIADAVMNSRNWALSVAMSHAYIHSMLSTLSSRPVAIGNLPPLQSLEDNLPELFVRAVELETSQVHSDSDFYDEWSRGKPHPFKSRGPKTFGP